MTKIDRAKVPTLIAQYLPVEICIYYQVVPIATESDSLILGMVDPDDLAALDYAGKMLSYSSFKIEPFPITFQQQQDLIAYYFSHPPDPQEMAAVKADQVRRTSKPVPIAPALPQPEPSLPPMAKTTVTATVRNSTQQPIRRTTETAIEDESDETVQQLLNSMLRRALDERADQIFVEPSDNHTCRVRYRQQGILRDLFKELSDSIRMKLLVNMKRMVSLDPLLMGESQSAEVERVYRGESLVLQLRIVPQRSKEGAVLSILRGDSLLKYQQNQNNNRVAEVLEIAQQTQQMMQQLHQVLGSTVDKMKQYPGKATSEWSVLTKTLNDINAHSQLIESYRQDWDRLTSG